MKETDIGEKVSAIFAAPAAEQIPALQRLRKELPQESIPTLDAFIDFAVSMKAALARGVDVVVVLLHGILTEAVWQDVVAEELESAGGVRVFRSGYGWIDPLKFWWPGKRRFASAMERCLRELRDARRQHPTSLLVVLAHSFSTYLMAKILEEHRDIVCSRLLLCGSIIPRDFRWDKVASPDAMLVVNEVGTKDYWPVMARVASWGYGASGTFGFQTNRVTNRYFAWGHSDFFDRAHIRDYWLPFVKSGTIVKSPWSTQRPVPSLWLSAAAGLPFIKLFLVVILASLVAIVGFAWNKFS